jgi:integrase
VSISHSFSSVLGTTISSYLTLKKSLGRHFRRETDVLVHLDRFLVSHTGDGGVALDAQLFAAWTLALAHLSPTVRRNRMRIVRNLCLYLRRTNPACFVPDRSSFPAPHAPLRPHIFTEEQIVRLLRAAAALQPWSHTPLCAETYRLAIVLLYTAGLRRGELSRLVLADYDPRERTLLVRASKFHKSRLVALSDDAAREMDLYMRARRRLAHAASAPLPLWKKTAGLLRGKSLPQRTTSPSWSLLPRPPASDSLTIIGNSHLRRLEVSNECRTSQCARPRATWLLR